MERSPTTVSSYLASLPPDRRQAIQIVRQLILDNLDNGYVEIIQYGMIGYAVPHSLYPAGYHCDPTQPDPFACLASRKSHMSLGLMGIYNNPEGRRWVEQAWAKSGKKLDMGQACIRFKTIVDLPLDVIAQAIRRLPAAAFIDHYQRSILTSNKAATAKRASKTAPSRRPARIGRPARSAPRKPATRPRRTKRSGRSA